MTRARDLGPWRRATSGRIRRTAAATVVAIAGATLLSGCGGASAETSAPASASPAASQGQTLDFIVELTSADNTLHTVGPAGKQIYGRNNLVGQAEVNGETVQVELLGNVDYTNGRGPFDGFLTLTFPDAGAAGGVGGTGGESTANPQAPDTQGEAPAPTATASTAPGSTGSSAPGGSASPSDSEVSILGTRVDGEATPVDSGTKFAARLEVIGGTGRFADTVGAGSFSGSRAEGVGGAVRLDITLVLDDTTG